MSPDGTRLSSGSQDVCKIATIDLTDCSTGDVFQADFLIDDMGLGADSEGNLYANSAGRIMRIDGDEAEALRFFVEMDVRQFLVASPDG